MCAESSSAQSQRSSEGQQCGGEPKEFPVPIPGAISPSKAFLISQRSLGAQRQVGTWIKDFRGRDTLSAGAFPGLSQRSLSPCGQAWNPLRWVNTRAPWDWEELLPGAWDTGGLGSLRGLPGPGESQPAVPLCVTVCTTNLAVGLWPWGLKYLGAWSWGDWDLGAAVGQTELLSPAARGMCTDVCSCAFSLMELCTVQPQGWGGWGSWCCVSALSVGPYCLCCQLCVSVYTWL